MSARWVSSLLKKVATLPTKEHCCVSTWNRINRASLLARSSSLSKRYSPYPLSQNQLHTEGDRRFVELLTDEVQQEKERSITLPTMSDGWKISLDGAVGKLTKSHDGDKIEVSFSLNGSIPPVPDEDMDPSQQEDDGGVVSYPEFTVKVTKSNNSKNIEFECFFPDDVQEGLNDHSINLFSIRSVVVYEGEITEGTYIIDTENLDPNVYSYLLSYLADRSVDNQFADEFVELTTAAEQLEYVRSLQKLKDFVACK